MQNLPLPHFQTNSTFFARRLWYYVVGVHDLCDDDVSLYVNHECIRKKSQNYFTSLLLHYLSTKGDGLKDDLYKHQMATHIYPMTRIFLIAGKKKKKATNEIPEEWDNLLISCRAKPSPFNNVNIDQSDLWNTKETVRLFFLKTLRPAVKLKPSRMLRITLNHQFLEIRDTYTGPWRSCMVLENLVICENCTVFRNQAVLYFITPLVTLCQNRTDFESWTSQTTAVVGKISVHY
ncbi:hypothetical protein PR048_012977, partial [Dryococelus australis]